MPLGEQLVLNNLREDQEVGLQIQLAAERQEVQHLRKLLAAER